MLLAAEQAGEVLEERELLTHEDAVRLVLAADLGEHAAQLRAALACGDRVGRRDERADRVERDDVRLDAELGAGVREDLRADALEACAPVHLALDLGDRGEDGVDVAIADRGGLGEDDLQQAPGGGELLVEVGEQRGAETGLCRRGGKQRGAHLVPSWLMALSIWTASPRPPSAMTASAIALGSMSR